MSDVTGAGRSSPVPFLELFFFGVPAGGLVGLGTNIDLFIPDLQIYHTKKLLT
jgi:hypothetical protein